MIKETLSSSEEYSSKRVLGTLCILTCIIILIISFFGMEISSIQADIIKAVLYTGAALLGVSAFQPRINRMNGTTPTINRRT